MLITCPNCDAGYEVPDYLLAGEGRWLRCKLCLGEWQARPPVAQHGATPSATFEPANFEITPPLMTEAPPARQQRRRLPWIAATSAWAASLVLVVSAGTLTVHQRASISVAWPPSERLFHLLP